jgi:uncharacterized protein (DUF2132 family)
MQEINKDPLHNVTLKTILENLVEIYGWQDLGYHIKIKCFNNKPSINSSLTFLRKTPWARTKVENFYIFTLKHKIKSEEIKNKTILSNEVE